MATGDRSRRLRPALLAAVPLLLAGCFTGDRPTVTSNPAVRSEDEAVDLGSDDEAIVAVVDQLVAPTDPLDAYTAVYRVVRTLGPVRSEAVIVADADRWSLTIGDVRYLQIDGVRSTCDMTTDECEDGFDEARISDVLTSTQFATRGAVRRLARLSRAAVSPATASQRTIAGQDATCAEIEVTGGTVAWCTVAAGLLALQETADMEIELRSLDDAVDPAAFEPLG